MAEQSCDCKAVSVLLFACAGASNVGQLSNAAAVELARVGRASMYCLAGIGAHVPGMVDSSQHAEYRVALDGCPVACARKTLEHAGVQVDRAVVITELGIEKHHQPEWSEQEVQRVIVATVAGLPT
jgi:uncharacterized metal-binding protein